MEYTEFIGKTVVKIHKIDDSALLFECSDGSKHIMHHEQDCCECVYIEDICGDLNDLIGSPILMAEESMQDDPDADESGTWTFYKFATIEGYVTIRWYGYSNGYYSEDADFYKVDSDGWEWKSYMEDVA